MMYLPPQISIRPSQIQTVPPSCSISPPPLRLWKINIKNPSIKLPPPQIHARREQMRDLTQRIILAGILDAEMSEVAGRELAPMLDFGGDDVEEGGVGELVQGATVVTVRYIC
jgi:hypothetical protein